MPVTNAAPTHLDRIVAQTRRDLVTRMAWTGRAALERAAAEHQPRGFAANLRMAAQSRPAIIAELKKASPSKGLIRAEFNPAALASAMEQAGAAALSVLTDEPFFQGSLRNLQIASDAVQIPCLRKDFMVDPFQIVEARAHGADAILLIVAALSDHELRTLRDAARDAELDVLCEVHSPGEIERALPLECELYGVNTRDLRTFHVNSDAALTMAQMLPATAVRVGESGIRTADDIARMSAAGFDAFLVGETLMRADDPGAALSELLEPMPSYGAIPSVDPFVLVPDLKTKG
ncbi:indole-3-glycerol phosphate synthase TrpC [Terriglobus sp.]|uniref:indole-3-glycerol phosphate synthase TrpC n=1 Tax=Terriglobus sp. TaxID=1889013 RepID=UPI003B00E936